MTAGINRSPSLRGRENSIAFTNQPQWDGTRPDFGFELACVGQAIVLVARRDSPVDGPSRFRH
jgi:hypothetical protein